MTINDIYGLNKSQAELDFVNIDVTRDKPLFLDPFFLGIRQDNFSISTSLTIQSFFQTLIDYIRSKNQKAAKNLFNHLHEPNSTCLGLSVGQPKGNGVGETDSSKLYDNILKSKAIESGLITDIEDSVLFIDNFGKDKLSDMVTNIIRDHLIYYTQSQCILHDIPLQNNIPSGFYWSRSNSQWEQKQTDMLIIDGRPILLVPKGIVSYSKQYIPENYYSNYVLEFMQNEHLSINSALVKTRKKDNSKYVTKKDLKERHPLTKDFLRDFTEKHPEVLLDFKEDVNISSLLNAELSNDVDIPKLCNVLGRELLAIRAGTDNANEFHSKILGILELLFYPKLIAPVKEQRIHDGRKRVDITFDNADNGGVFSWLSEKLRLPCPYVYIECKNYSSDPKNPEIDQLSGRFSFKRGQVGFIICRTFSDRNLFIKRCRDTFKDDRGLVITLVDSDIINLLDNYNEYNDSFFEKYIRDIVREITID